MNEQRMNDREFLEALGELIIQVCKNAGRTTIDIGLLNEVALEQERRLRKLKEDNR